MNSRHLLHRFLYLSLILGAGVGGLGPTTPMAAIASGRIEGRVTDWIGQSLPGVSVTTIPQRGGQAQHTTTDDEGTYRLEALPEDTYRVDFELRGCDAVRQNHVSVGLTTRATVDTVLHVRPICECISVRPPGTARPLRGQVVDERGLPLPYARLEVVTPLGRETSLADRGGHFLLRAPINGTLPLVASDSGFATVTRQISEFSAEPVVLRLRYVGTDGLPNTERSNQGCPCPGYFADAE
jgi:hypothetical protein